ncbi:MAG: protein of unknown function rane [Modestobacter sp.]|nr:protein of unknown function rane [Modestobacter sp.]
MTSADQAPPARGDRRSRGDGPRVDVARRLSNLLGVRGFLAVLFGVVVLVWPAVTVLALALVFAVHAVLDGIGLVTSGLGGRDRPRRWSWVVAGLAGVIAAVWPEITALVLVLVVGVWAVITGVLQIAAAVRLRSAGSRGWVLALSGVVSLIAGVIVLAHADVGVLALAAVVGVAALLIGVALLWAAWQVRTGRVVVLRIALPTGG